MEASSSTSTMTITDPVSSLRAAALSTLKSKRRKQVSEAPASIPARPPPPSDNFQLDYGQDDVSMADARTSVSSTTAQNTKEPIAQHAEDAHTREEGEISEEEEPLPVIKQPVPLIERLSDSPMPIMRKSSTPESSSAQTESSASSRSTPEMEPVQAPRLALVDRISDELYLPDEGLQNAPPVGEPHLHSPSILYMGPDCVRPGLHLNQEQYDTVKDIILDLLGWGVTFEYLVECGLSKEVLYYVFNELELSLPDSFDSTGIPPYTPEAFSFPQNHVLTSSHIHQEEQYKLLPPTINAVVGSTSKSTTLLPAQAVLSISDNPIVTDLHDMERQRRQELMARKAAVLASRKQKESMSMSAIVNTDGPQESENKSDEKHSLGPAVPDVDDFLNSLASVKSLEDPLAGPPSLQQVIDEEVMQVDSTSNHEHPVQKSDMEDQVIESSVLNLPPPSSSEPPPMSVDSSVSTFSESSQSSEITPTAFIPSSQRRGTKRPVASDFVDLEPIAKRHEALDREHIHGHSKRVGITRKLTSGSGFQGISSRRCVIELSDSEDDEEDPALNEVEQPPVAWRDQRHKPPSNAPSPIPFRPSSSGATTPGALAEKEAEIRKMREMIARREERLRKLALTRSASTATNSQPTAIEKSQVSKPVSTSGVEPVELITPQLEQQEADANREVDSTPNSFAGAESSTLSPIGSIDSRTENGERNTNELENDSKSAENQDEASDTHDAQAASIPHDQRIQSTERGSVDADQNSSPSTQVLPAVIPSVHPRPDANWLSQSSSPNNKVGDDIQDGFTFTAYCSPFDSYPLLHDSLLLSTGAKTARESLSNSSFTYPSSPLLLPLDSSSAYTKHYISSDSSSASRLGIPLPNMKPLKQATTAKLLDPHKRICQYEVPGGGTCRDEGCEDVHLSRLEGVNELGIIEPNDDDTAQYLFNTLPGSWLSQNRIDSPSQILSALHDVHHRTLNNPLGFEDRIERAIEALVSSTPPT